MKRLLLYIELIIFAGALYYVFNFQQEVSSPCKAEYSEKLELSTGRIESNAPFRVTYAFRLNFGHPQDLDFIITELGDKPRLRYIKHLGGGKFAEDLEFPQFFTEHARDLSAFYWNKKKAFIITDHGHDTHPYLGAFPRIFVEESQGWVEKTNELLPHFPSFNFTVVAIDTKRLNPDLFVSVVGSEKQNSYLLRNQKNGVYQWANVLPEEYKNPSFCYMSSKVLLKSKEQSPDETFVFVGGCDRNENQKHMVRDRILSFSKDKIEFLPESSLPPRLLDSGWGTVNADSGDLDNDGLPDIAAAVHNTGFTKGGIQIYINDGQMKFHSPEKLIAETEGDQPSFVPFVKIADLDGDGFGEILAPIVGIYRDGIEPKLSQFFFLLKRKKDGSYKDITKCTSSALKHIMATEFGDFDDDGKIDILLLSHNGDYEILFNRFP